MSTVTHAANRRFRFMLCFFEDVPFNRLDQHLKPAAVKGLVMKKKVEKNVCLVY